MGMFKMEKPRRFNHQYIYVDERKEKLQTGGESQTRVGYASSQRIFSGRYPWKVRSRYQAFKRRKESGRKPMTYGALFVAILVLLYILHYLVTGEFTFNYVSL